MKTYKATRKSLCTFEVVEEFIVKAESEEQAHDLIDNGEYESAEELSSNQVETFVLDFKAKEVKNKRSVR